MSQNNADKIGYTKLYCPGRVAVIIAVLLLVAIIGSYYLVMAGVIHFSYIVVLMALPFVVVIIDFFMRKRLLPRGKQKTQLALSLKKLKLRWLLRKNGSGLRQWDRKKLDLPRTVADSSFKDKLSKVIIPDGLVEPEKITASRPGSLFGCILGTAIALLVIWGLISTGVTSLLKWSVIALLCWNILRLILGLPSIHRSRKLPFVLRAIGRRRLLGIPIVVGPGWVKRGKNVWHANRDMLLIRRTGFRPASSEIDCMLAGPNRRSRLSFSGIGDEDFQLLFRFWNVDEVRLEFIDSELS